jgi:hypothetical protein
MTAVANDTKQDKPDQQAINDEDPAIRSDDAAAGVNN